MYVAISYARSLRSLNRSAYLAYYGQALCTYRDITGKDPVFDSMEHFVREYNSLRGEGMLPSTADFPLPMFRPITDHDSGEGPFLVLIESSPLKWSDAGRWVLYTDASYSQKAIRHVAVQELPKLIAEDERVRALARSTSAPGSMPALLR